LTRNQGKDHYQSTGNIGAASATNLGQEYGGLAPSEMSTGRASMASTPLLDQNNPMINQLL